MAEPFTTVIGEGNHRASLEALRDLLATNLTQAEPREVAALARQLSLVLKELDELPAEKGRSTLDDLAARRRNRGAKTAG